MLGLLFLTQSELYVIKLESRFLKHRNFKWIIQYVLESISETLHISWITNSYTMQKSSNKKGTFALSMFKNEGNLNPDLYLYF